MIQIVTKSLGNQFAETTNELVKHITTLTEKIADTELRLDSVSSYHEQTIYSLKAGLQKTFHKIELDMKTLVARCTSCECCGQNSKILDILKTHFQDIYTPAIPLNCSLSGEALLYNQNIYKHSPQVHHPAPQDFHALLPHYDSSGQAVHL